MSHARAPSLRGSIESSGERPQVSHRNRSMGKNGTTDALMLCGVSTRCDLAPAAFAPSAFERQPLAQGRSLDQRRMPESNDIRRAGVVTSSATIMNAIIKA
jgi:hypothetical protein